MSANPCKYDKDCLETQACYTNVSWYSPGPGENGCLCSTYYGWSGPACNVTGQTVTSRVWLGFGLVITISLAIIFAVGLSLVIRLYRLKLISFKVETVGTVQLLMACCFGIIYEVGATWAAYSPSYGGYIPGVDTNDRQNVYHSIWQAFDAVFVIVSFGATMTIALVWIELANKVKSLVKASGALSRNQIWMAAYELVVMLAMVIPLIFGMTGVASLVSYVLAISLLSVYIYGYRMMTRVIMEMGRSSSDGSPMNQVYRPVLKEMRRTAMWICGVVLIITCIYTAVVSTVFYGWKVSSRAEPYVSDQVILVKVLGLCVTALDAATLHFVRQCGERQIRRQTKSVSAVDSMNRVETLTAAT